MLWILRHLGFKIYRSNKYLMQDLQDDILWPVSSMTVMTPVPYGCRNYKLLLAEAKEYLHLLYFCGY